MRKRHKIDAALKRAISLSSHHQLRIS